MTGGIAALQPLIGPRPWPATQAVCDELPCAKPAGIADPFAAIVTPAAQEALLAKRTLTAGADAATGGPGAQEMASPAIRLPRQKPQPGADVLNQLPRCGAGSLMTLARAHG